MLWRLWFSAGRRLAALFLTLAALLSGAILWLGWRLSQQDRQMAMQRLQEARESAADLAVATLQRSLSQAEDELASLATLPLSELRQRAGRQAAALPPDSAIALLRNGALEAFPERRLPFYPGTAGSARAHKELFAVAEALEFRNQDYPGALSALARVARTNDPALRAAANIRLARIHRKLGRWKEALAIYEQTLPLGAALADGLPAELVARHARFTTFRQQQQELAARKEAEALLAILTGHRYRLSRGAYEFFETDARRAAPAAAREPEPALALAAAAEILAEVDTTGRRVVIEHNQPALVLWRVASGDVNAFLLGARWLEAQWSGTTRASLEAQGSMIRLTTTEGRPVLGPAAPGAGGETVHLAAATGLPWNVHVVTAAPERVLAPLEVRRRLLLAALALIALLTLAGAYLVSRAVNRELAVSRLQSDFVSAVSHEFRTPLTSLCLLSEQLASGKVTDEVMRAGYYQTLERESQRLRRLVEGLLNFGRAEAGAAEYRFEIQDPAELVRDVARQFERDVATDGYCVEVTVDERVPLVRADRAALACVVWNLLDNAVKYSPDCRTVWARLDAEDGRAAIRIIDRGMGIPKDEQSRIFGKFVRGEAVRIAGIRGTGIGLAMARRIIDAHGGEIRLESKEGEGATFTVLLPAAT